MLTKHANDKLGRPNPTTFFSRCARLDVPNCSILVFMLLSPFPHNQSYSLSRFDLPTDTVVTRSSHSASIRKANLHRPPRSARAIEDGADPPGRHPQRAQPTTTGRFRPEDGVLFWVWYPLALFALGFAYFVYFAFS